MPTAVPRARGRFASAAQTMSGTLSVNVAWSPAPPTPVVSMLTAPRQEGEKDPGEETLC